MAIFNLQAIVERRSKLGLSSAAVAKKLGMTESAYWKYEHGQYKFRAEDLPKLAVALKCSVSRFYANDGSKIEQNSAQN